MYRVSGSGTHRLLGHSHSLFIGRPMTPTREHKIHIKYILGKTNIIPISYIRIFDSSFLAIYPPPPSPHYHFHSQIQRSQTNAHFLSSSLSFRLLLLLFLCFMPVCYSVLFCSIPSCLCPTQTLLSRAMHICFCTTLLYGQTLSSQPTLQILC